MGIKTILSEWMHNPVTTLKNLPTTWGLRHQCEDHALRHQVPLKNLPTTWGLRQLGLTRDDKDNKL